MTEHLGDRKVLSYIGSRKINAIKAVRTILATSLLISKQAVEHGCIVTELQAYAICGAYARNGGGSQDVLDFHIAPAPNMMRDFTTGSYSCD